MRVQEVLIFGKLRGKDVGKPMEYWNVESPFKHLKKKTGIKLHPSPISIKRLKNSYFLVNDKWSINVLGEIKQFGEIVAKYNYSNKNISFKFTNPSINLEVKYIYYQ